MAIYQAAVFKPHTLTTLLQDDIENNTPLINTFYNIVSIASNMSG
jgi:hypothetical protein